MRGAEETSRLLVFGLCKARLLALNAIAPLAARGDVAGVATGFLLFYKCFWRSALSTEERRDR